MYELLTQSNGDESQPRKLHCSGLWATTPLREVLCQWRAIQRMKFNFRKQREETPPEAPESTHSPSMEKATLGCLLEHPDYIAHAAEHLSPEHFYGVIHRQIFEEVLAFGLKAEHFDVVLFTQWLSDKKLLATIGGPAFLFELSREVSIHTQYFSYVKILSEKLRQRNVWEAAEKIKSAIASGGEFEVVSGEVNLSLAKIQEEMSVSHENSKEQWGEKVDGVASDWTLRYQGKMISAIASPWDAWNRTLGGIRKGYNLILGAKKTGKSSLMGHMALHLSVQKNMRSIIFTYETPVDDYIMRLASNLSGVRGDCIFSPDLDPPRQHEIGRISDAFGKIASAPIKIVKGNGLGVRDISREAKKFNAFFVVVDYLLLLPRLPEVNQKEGTEGSVRANSCALIELSREIDGVVAVINHTASSGDRKGESRWGDQPENDCDLCLLVEDKGITVKSRRNGESGAVIPVKFHGETYSFKEN